MAQAVETAFCISGGISGVHPSLYIDGATHMIHTSIVGSIRLVPANHKIKEALDKYQDKEISVAVCGYPGRSVNCTHMHVQIAEPAAQFGKKLASMGGMDSGG
jgi:hypothetical protein